MAAKEKSRRSVLEEVESARLAWHRNTDEPKSAYTYANLLYQSGDFWEAWKVVQPQLQASRVSADALALGAKLAYMLGKHSAAETLGLKAIESNKRDTTVKAMAMIDLLYAYYHQDKFDEIRALKFPAGVSLPNVEAIKAFKGQPYQLEWVGTGERAAIVPFLATDPLVAVKVEVNGVSLAMLLDTGGDQLILDPEVAHSMGIKALATTEGTFGGGLKSEVGFGRTESLKLGSVTLKNVPVMTLPTKRMSSIWQGAGIEIGGIIGTAVLRQFLSTVDYQNGQLVLRERNAKSVDSVRQQLTGRIAAEVPFAMHLTHLMMVRGGINEQEGLTFMVDCGVAASDKKDNAIVLTVPLQTLTYLGIPEPQRKIQGGVSGGEGSLARGLFDLASASMGPLTQKNVQGDYGTLIPQSYWQHGFIQDGFIIHAFLRRYSSWTLDFDGMTYIFER